MDEDILVPAMFFVTVIVLMLGLPMLKIYADRKKRESEASRLTPELANRLDRIESMIETVSIEVERLAEGQRFTTRLLSESSALLSLPQAHATVADRVDGLLDVRTGN
jgi:hypothetical protein